MNLHRLLRERAETATPVRAGLIGAGKFGSMFLAQIPTTPGLELAAIADLDPERARGACRAVGWDEERIGRAAFVEGGADLAARDIAQVSRGAVAKPLIIFIAVEGQPVDQALVLDDAIEPRLPVVAQIVVDERQAPCPAREDRGLVAPDARVQNANVPAAIDADCNAAGGIGIGICRSSGHCRAGEVEGYVVAADDYHCGIRRPDRQVVGPRRHMSRSGNHQSAAKLDPLCVDTRRGEGAECHYGYNGKDEPPGRQMISVSGFSIYRRRV